MCRLLAYRANGATTLDDLIGPAQGATFRAMSRLHSDGWGTAWLDATGSLRQTREVTPSTGSSRLAEAMSVDISPARIVHLRMATAGFPVTIANTHPFVDEGIAFAHNGTVTPRQAMRSQLDPAIADSISGNSDSELYFALIRQRVHAGQSLFQATCDVVSDLRAVYPSASLNALLLDAERLVAVHASEGALIPHREFQASGLAAHELPQDHRDRYYLMSYLRKSDGTTVFASTGIARHGWTPMPQMSVAVVDLADGSFRIRELSPTPARATA